MQKDDQETNIGRRRFVKLAAGSAAVLPLGALVGCGGGDDSSASSSAREAADAAAEAASEATEATQQAASDAGDAMRDAADDAGDTMGQMADDAQDSMQQMADDAKGAAGDVMDDAKDAAGDMMNDAKDAAQSAAGKMPKLEESNAQAQALGYKHDASQIDTSKYPGRGAEANEYCRNCSLYTAGKDGWGACSIFAGKQVSAEGWCVSYNRAAG